MDSKTTGLIALDFDGTSAVYEPQLALHPACLDIISEFLDRGYGWVINSDRFTDTLVEVANMLPLSLRPDGILSAQRCIHTRTADGAYAPLQKWNDSRMELHNALWKEISPCFDGWQREIESEFSICERYVDDLVFAYRVPAHENTALHKRMRGYIRPWRSAQLSGNHEWSFILHADFSKAALLEHYCTVRGINTQKIIAVGDGFNDISMLDAGLTPNMGCPADAGTEVIAAVRAGGGYVAESSGPEGTIEVLRYYQGSMDA
jgi:hydroxymethylpyrimidine pyrophosphatase-like HAD family hydrolase